MTDSTLGSQFFQKSTNNETNGYSWSFQPLSNFSERKTTKNTKIDHFSSEHQSELSPNIGEIAEKHLQKELENGQKLENNPNIGSHVSFQMGITHSSVKTMKKVLA